MALQCLFIRRVEEIQQAEKERMAKFMSDMGLQPGQRITIKPRGPPSQICTGMKGGKKGERTKGCGARRKRFF